MRTELVLWQKGAVYPTLKAADKKALLSAGRPECVVQTGWRGQGKEFWLPFRLLRVDSAQAELQCMC